MNNAIIVKAKTPEEALQKITSESDEVFIATTYRSLTTLRGTIHFKKYIELFIEPEIQKKIRSLRAEKDFGGARYLQGYLDGIEKFKNIEQFEKLYKAKLENNGKKRNTRR